MLRKASVAKTDPLKEMAEQPDFAMRRLGGTEMVEMFHCQSTRWNHGKGRRRKQHKDPSSLSSIKFMSVFSFSLFARHCERYVMLHSA